MSKSLGSLYAYLNLDAKDFDKNLKIVQRNLRRASRDFNQVGRSLTKSLTVPLTLIGGLGVKSFVDFDKAMTNSLSIMSGVSASMRKEMEATAKNIARTTTFSATKAGESYYFLASAGLRAEQSIAALPQVAKFAQAGMFDMALATDLATDAQSALGLTVTDSQENLENMTRVTDVLTKASQLANATIEQFSVSLTNKAGTALRNTNKEIEEGVAVLAAYADQGIKGEAAGTALNIVMRDLQTQFRKNRDEFTKAGVAVFDSAGNFNNLGVVVGQLEQKLEGMSTAQKNATLAQLGFTDKSMSFMLSLVGMSDRIKDYEAKLRSAGGATQEVADKQMESFSAQLTVIKQKIELALIPIGQRLTPMLVALGNGISSVAGWFENLSPKMQDFIVGMGVAAASIGPVLLGVGALASAGAMLALLLGKTVVLAIGAFVAGIGIAAATIYTFREEIGQFLSDTWSGLSNFTSSASALIVDVFTYTIPNALIETMNFFARMANTIIEKLQESIKWGIRPFADAIEALTGKKLKIMDIEAPQLKELEKKVREVTTELNKTEIKFKSVGDEVQKTEPKFKKFKEGIDKLKTGFFDFGNESEKSSKKASKALDQVAEAAKKAQEDVSRQISTIKRESEDLDIRENIRRALIDRNQVELERWADELKKFTEKGIVEGFEQAGGKLDASSRPLLEELTGQKFNRELDKILKDHNDRESKAVIDLLRGIDEKNKEFDVRKNQFFQQMSGVFAQSLVEGISEGFSGASLAKISSSLSGVFSSMFSNSLNNMFADGFSMQGLGDAGLGLAGALGMSYLGSITNNRNENGIRVRSDGATGALAGGASGAATGAMVGGWVGAIVGGVAGVIGGAIMANQGISNPDHISRKETGRWINDRLAQSGSLGFLQDGKVEFGDPNRWNYEEKDIQHFGSQYIDTGQMRDAPGVDWADAFWEMSGDLGQAFHSMGMVIEGFAGNAGEEFGKLGVILFENLGGGIDNARLMLQTLGIGTQEYTDMLMKMGMQGKFTWHEIELGLQQVNLLTGEGLVAFGDMAGALEQVRASGNRGHSALIGFRNIVVEAGEAGINTFDGLRDAMIAQGSSVEDVDIILQALSQRGITSMEQLRAASDREIGGVLADMESLGFGFSHIAEGIDGATLSINELDKKLKTLENRDVDINVNLKYSERNKPNDFESIAPKNVQAFAKGGIVGSPTMFDTNLGLAGEAGPEGILPLKRMSDGDLGVRAELGGAPQIVYNIDARGGEAGIENRIIAALKQVERDAISGSIQAVYQLKRRGAF